MDEERMQILRMLEQGNVSAEDAARLLDALQETPAGPDNVPGGKKLRIRVSDRETQKKKVNLTIPMGLAKIAAKLVPPKAKQKLADEGVDVDTVVAQLVSENIGKVVDIETEDEIVEISIE
jgi:hypothetical protein